MNKYSRRTMNPRYQQRRGKRVGVSSVATELSLKLSNNFRDVKFDSNCMLRAFKTIACNYGLFYCNMSISRKNFVMKESRIVKKYRPISSITDLYVRINNI